MTQVSRLVPPRCIDRLASSRCATRVMPPGNTCQRPSPSAMAYTRTMAGRGVTAPPPQMGAREKRKRSCTVQASGSSSTTAGRRSGGSSWMRERPPSRGYVLRRILSCSRSRTSCHAASSPHHQVGSEGKVSGWPPRRLAMAGRKPWIAGDSRNALPSALAITTWPLRAACSRPGTPRALSGRSSSGSHQSSSSRRMTPCTGSRPSTDFRYRRSPRTVRSPPSTSGRPR